MLADAPGGGGDLKGFKFRGGVCVRACVCKCVYVCVCVFMLWKSQIKLLSCKRSFSNPAALVFSVRNVTDFVLDW